MTTASLRDPYFDGIRALAIGTVLAVHWVSVYVPYFKGGYIGVDVFFVLSGFIITMMLWRRPIGKSLGHDYKAFIRGRVRRLYPALLGSLVGATLLVWAFSNPVSVSRAISSAGIAVSQLTSFARGLELDTVEPFAHTWTLSVEWMFYLLWPIALFAAKRRGVHPLRIALWATVASLVLYAVTLPASGEWFYYGLTSRSAQILCGCAVAMWAVSDLRPRIGRNTVNALLLVAVSAILVWTVFGVNERDDPYRWLGYPVVTISSALLCAGPFLHSGTWVQRAISLRPFAALGLVSYSLYLWHLIFLQVLDKDNLPLSSPVLGILGVLGTAVLTAISYALLERRFMGAAPLQASALRRVE